MGGVVVTPAWIWDCQRLQKRLPCEPYGIHPLQMGVFMGDGGGEGVHMGTLGSLWGLGGFMGSMGDYMGAGGSVWGP